jgi:hypothetical protein
LRFARHAERRTEIHQSLRGPMPRRGGGSRRQPEPRHDARRRDRPTRGASTRLRCRREGGTLARQAASPPRSSVRCRAGLRAALKPSETPPWRSTRARARCRPRARSSRARSRASTRPRPRRRAPSVGAGDEALEVRQRVATCSAQHNSKPDAVGVARCPATAGRGVGGAASATRAVRVGKARGFEPWRA